MSRRIYAGAITKEYLKKLGIEYVSTDGKYIIKNGKLAHICISKKTKKPYGFVYLYDSDIRAAVPLKERTNHIGSIIIGAHVINYVWNKADKPEGMVIDHIDNDPTNNDISNLQCITQQENLAKEKGEPTRMINCNMHKPRSFYEDKLNIYTEAYEQAKKEHNADLCRSLRGNISQTRARLRYWDSHKEDYWAHIEAKTKEINDKQIWRLKTKLKKLIAEKKKLYKESGDLESWRKCCALFKAVDKQEACKILEICEKLHIKLNNVEPLESR